MNHAQGTLPDRKSAKKPRNPRHNGEKRRLARPAGADTALTKPDLASLHATKALAEMPGCQLSDAAVTLVTLRVNTAQNVAALARQLKMSRHQAHNILASPSGQELMARLARSMLGYASTTGLRTLEDLCTHKDAHIRMQAAQDLLERAGLGLSQRATPPASSQAFAFAFHTKDEAAK